MLCPVYQTYINTFDYTQTHKNQRPLLYILYYELEVRV